ncbi:androgen-binding protein homolog [Microtus ochrogaster]|uniref:Androgen-binding protein homolog n=1 Tax=Microtus ochrogaster TaxID=79684 RepID=A0ABM0LSW9_MICOH|nr:androgen-binding protein homolog [Microtus ochrogaster]
MKGTLLLLALLVTGELGFQTTEACGPYFEAFAGISIGNKKILNAVLDKFEPTDGERLGFKKIMECLNDEGVEGKILKTKFMGAIIFSPECREYYTQDISDKFQGILSKVNLFGK